MRKALSLFFMCVSINALAGQIPMPDVENRVRLAEAFALASSLQDDVWPEWSSVPFVVLLVTPEFEYLVHHPYPPEDFVSLGTDDVMETEVFARKFSGNFNTGFLATFPAVNGVNTVVIGTPENTDKHSTHWVITALHEHFHQLQFTRPWYYEEVELLDLSNGDETGMWQLNYPFPYGDDQVAVLINRYRDALLEGLKSLDGDQPAELSAVNQASCALFDELKPADGRYFDFQLWQEGVARFTEHEVAALASMQHRPREDFVALEDFVPYETSLEQLNARLRSELEDINLAEWKRLVFYPLGAAHALLLNAASSDWKQRYFSEPFSLGCFPGLPRPSG